MPHELDPRLMFPETAEFWTAAAENRLLVKRCETCSRAHFYPRAHCPFCHSARTRWEEVSGAGTIYSFSVQGNLRPAVATAAIDIGDDIRLQSVVVDADMSKLHIGQGVQFAPIQGGLAPELAFTTPASIAARRYAERAIQAAQDSPSFSSAQGGSAAPGLIRDRMLRARDAEARQMLLEGSTPAQVDQVLARFGMPTGAFEAADAAMAINAGSAQDAEQADSVLQAMMRTGRTGLQVGKGFYKYKLGSSKPEPDPEVVAMLKTLSTDAGITRRALPDDEIEERLILVQVHEALRILQDEITERPVDIDAACLQEFGWPSWRGGPLYYAEDVGLSRIQARLEALAQTVGTQHTPCDLLARLVHEGRSIDIPR